MKTLRLILYPILTISVTYLLFAFGTANLNISEWPEKVRGICAFLMFTFSIVSLALADLKNFVD